MYKIICLFALMATLWSCNDEDHEVFKKHAAVVSKASNVELFRIKDTPTAPDQQDASKKYMHDYEVEKVFELDAKAQAAFKKAVLETKNYNKDDKKCPFEPGYILKFEDGKDHITMVIAAAKCEKAAMFSSIDQLDDKFFADLAEQNNSLINLLKTY